MKESGGVNVCRCMVVWAVEVRMGAVYLWDRQCAKNLHFDLTVYVICKMLVSTNKSHLLWSLSRTNTDKSDNSKITS